VNQLGTNHLLYLLIAAQWTVALSLIAFVGGSILGLVIALMRVSKSGIVRGVASGYIQLIQGTPLLIVLFLSYFGLGIIGLKLVPLVAAGISLRSGVAASRRCRRPSGRPRTVSASTASSNTPT
jgi:polar amino acid transport system permease protein